MASAYLTIPHLSTKDLVRFFSKISIRPDVQWNGTPCWNWTGATVLGYGFAWCRQSRRYEKTHRIAYARLVHPLPRGRQDGELDHLCRNKACANPAHLEFVTARINTLRNTGPSAINAKKTHCIRGHLLIVGGTRNGNPTRRCKECHQERSRRSWRDRPDYHKAAVRQWRERNLETVRLKDRQYQAERRAKRKAIKEQSD